MDQLTQTMLVTPEWSYKVEVADLPDAPLHVSFGASDQECRDLARRLKVKLIEELRAEFAVRRGRNNGSVLVSGRVQGRVIQACVVTTEDIAQAIDEPFEAWFADRESAISFARARQNRLSRHPDAEVQMLEEHEDPEPIIDGRIDLGELAAQYLSLAINPYPRSDKAGEAETRALLEEKGATEHIRNPFAALKKWKDDRQRNDKH